MKVATAVLSGTVKDNQGQALPGMTVILTNVETNVSQMTMTNMDGHYRFPGIAPGVYALKAESEGFTQVEVTGIDLTVGQDAALDITMQRQLAE